MKRKRLVFAGLVCVALAIFLSLGGLAAPEKTGKGKPAYAVWYRVPSNSLAKRRAGSDELTAADDHLPLGTLVRVTNPANNKSVVVRVTDRGLKDRHAQIDLCREAAEQLGMVKEGKV